VFSIRAKPCFSTASDLVAQKNEKIELILPNQTLL